MKNLILTIGTIMFLSSCSVYMMECHNDEGAAEFKYRKPKSAELIYHTEQSCGNDTLYIGS